MIFLLIVLGLASRKFSWLFPGVLQKNLGDIIWGTMVFFIFGFVFPQFSTRRVAALAFLFSCCIEVSKLFHAPWFDTLRATGVGRLVFGYVFGWSNICCYFTGIVLGVAWDYGMAFKPMRMPKMTKF